jgi:F420-dependent oxidoreductase-like protein
MAAAQRKPWFGLHLPNYTFPDTPPEKQFDRIVEQAQAAEAAGFGLVSVMDHLYQIGGVGAVDEPMLESWSVLNALARETRRVRLGTLVTGVTYRNPAMLAKMATTLDVTSGGRAILGLGAAWNEREHIAFGYDFPSVKERMDRLEEALAIARAMFADERPTLRGTHYRVDAIINAPPPVQHNGPPILVGGGGEQRTLRIAAKYADMTHWFAIGLPALVHKTELLLRYCDEIERDPQTIERTMGAPVVVATTDAEAEARVAHVPAERRTFLVVGPPEKAAEGLRPYLDAGFTGFTFNNTIYRTPEAIAAVGEVLGLIGG